MKLHKRIARWFGYNLVCVRKNHLTLEGHLLILFNLLKINLVLDVGANIGQYAKSLRKIGYCGYIISFEPIKSSYEALIEHSKDDPKWHIYNLALGSVNDTKSINVTKGSDLTSFLKPNEYAKRLFKTKADIDQIEMVEIRRLDELLPEILDGIKEPKLFLKTDTQGYDLEVLKGASLVMDKVLALQSEISMVPIYERMPGFLEALDEYRRVGLEITGFYPVSRDKSSLKVIEFDCVMTRRMQNVISRL